MPCKKNRPLCSACCSSLPFSGCMHGGIFRLLSPRGTSPNSFSVNFHPLPNSDRAFLPPTPQWRICPRSLCPPLTSFFWLLPLCRQHAAYANTHPFIRETPPLNECNLKWGHTCAHLQRGHGNGGSARPLSTRKSLKRRALTILSKWAGRYVWLTDYFICVSAHVVYPDRWITGKITQGRRCGPQRMAR